MLHAATRSLVQQPAHESASPSVSPGRWNLASSERLSGPRGARSPAATGLARAGEDEEPDEDVGDGDSVAVTGERLRLFALANIALSSHTPRS